MMQVQKDKETTKLHYIFTLFHTAKKTYGLHILHFIFKPLSNYLHLIKTLFTNPNFWQ